MPNDTSLPRGSDLTQRRLYDDHRRLYEDQMEAIRAEFEAHPHRLTSGMIADEMKHQFDIALDKKKIHLEHSIRTTGEYEVELNLHHEVKGTLKVRVESTTPAVAAADVPVEEKPHSEKRGKRQEDAPEARPGGPKAEKTDKGEKPVKAPKAEKSDKAEKKPKAA